MEKKIPEHAAMNAAIDGDCIEHSLKHQWNFGDIPLPSDNELHTLLLLKYLKSITYSFLDIRSSLLRLERLWEKRENVA